MEIPIYEIFDKIRSGEMGDAEVFRFLRDYSNNYDAEILQFILRDLDFYFFVEKEEKESEFSEEIKQMKIKEYEERNIEIPIFPRNTDFTEKQLENRARMKEKGLDLDSFPPMINWEKILYPHEFWLLYRFKHLVQKKLKEQKENKLNEPETFQIPDNDYSGKNELKPKEKLILLDKLGIIDLLIKKLEYSDNATHLTEIIQSITGIDNQKGTLTGYCNYLIRADHSNKNSPYFSENTVKKATQIYNTFRIKDKTD